MEISSNSLNQPVNFYAKNTGNNINMAIESENGLYQSNIFAPEFGIKKIEKASFPAHKKKRKSKRLNTIDSDYLPDEIENSDTEEQKNDNFFLKQEQKSIRERLKIAIDNFLMSAPLINCFFLKQKRQKLQKIINTLTDINQNVDELLNTAVPYGEEEKVYKDIAKNLTAAAGVLGKSNKNL